MDRAIYIYMAPSTHICHRNQHSISGRSSKKIYSDPQNNVVFGMFQRQRFFYKTWLQNSPGARLNDQKSTRSTKIVSFLGKFPSIFQYLRYFQIFRGFHHREFRNKTIVVGHNVPEIPKIWDFWQISGRSSPPAIEISGNSGVFRLHALRTFFFIKNQPESRRQLIRMRASCPKIPENQYFVRKLWHL